MVERWAEKLALTLKRANPDETASVEVMKFSLAIILNFLAVTVLSLLISSIFHTAKGTAIAMIGFALLRAVSGGVHLPASEWCIAVSTLIFVTISHLPITEIWCIILTVASLGLVLLFAPSRIEKQSRIPKTYYPALKAASGFIVALNFVFMSSDLAAAFFIQSLLLIKLKFPKSSHA